MYDVNFTFGDSNQPVGRGKEITMNNHNKMKMQDRLGEKWQRGGRREGRSFMKIISFFHTLANYKKIKH